MKKTTFRQKLVLRTQTITVLSNEHHQVVAAAAGAPFSINCPVVPVDPK